MVLVPLGFSVAAESVYLAMLPNPEWTVRDLSVHLELTEDQVHAALDELADAALVRPSVSQPGRMRPASPRAGFAALLAQAEAEDRIRQQQLQATRAALSAAMAHYDAAREPEPVTRLTTVDAVRERLEELAYGATTECLSLNPGRSRSLAARSSSAPLNQAALERGVTIRCVYQDSVRNHPATFEYVKWLAGIGVQLRTIPAIPMTVVIVDRRVALIPLNPLDSRGGAVEVAAPGIVSVVVAYFEQMWSAATPVVDKPTDDAQGLSAQERALLGYLSAGYTDDMAARKLAVSLRTVRRMAADLMARLDSRSRFQAGIQAARRGWLD